MSVLKRSQRVFKGLNLIGNFIERPLQVGDIVVNDDGQHLIWGNIADVIDGFSLRGKTKTSNRANLKFTRESNVEITFGSSASTKVAKGEVELKFKSKNSAFVSLNKIKRKSVKLGLVDLQLKEYWSQKGFDKGRNRNKYHFIAETIEASSGVVIFSKSSGNKVVISGKNNIPITNLTSIGSGKVELIKSSKATLEIISESKIQPLYTAVRYRANGNFEIVG